MRLPKLFRQTVPAADLRAVKLRLRTAEFARSAAELRLSEEKQRVAALLSELRIQADTRATLLVQAHDDLGELVKRLDVVQDVSANRALQIAQLRNAIIGYLDVPAGRKGYAAARKTLAAKVGR